MVPSDATKSLRASPLFAALDEAQLARVVAGVRPVKLAVGELLFERGQPARQIFLLESGRMKLALYSPQGQEKIVDLIGPGDTFAEAVLFSHSPRYPVTASALAASRVWAIAGAPYLEVLAESADTALAVMAALSRRLHWQVNEIDRLTLHNALFRVTAYLLEQLPAGCGERARFALDLPKNVIAARLSVTPETLSRTFAKLEQDGYIRMQGNRVEIPRIGHLRSLLLA